MSSGHFSSPRRGPHLSSDPEIQCRAIYVEIHCLSVHCSVSDTEFLRKLSTALFASCSVITRENGQDTM